MFKNFNLASILSIIIIGLFVGVVFVYADWTAPKLSPPNCETNPASLNYDPACDAPINTGVVSQTKNSGLGITTDLIIGSKAAIGALIGSSQLTVNGIIETISGGIKFPDGTIQSSAANVVAHAPIGGWVSIGVSNAIGGNDVVIAGNVIDFNAPQPIIAVRMSPTGAGDPVGCESYSNNLFHFFTGKGDTAGGNGWTVYDLPLTGFSTIGYSGTELTVSGADDSSGGPSLSPFYFGGGPTGASAAMRMGADNIPIFGRDWSQTMGYAWKIAPGLNFVPVGKTISFRAVGSSDAGGGLNVGCEAWVLYGNPVSG